METTDLKLSPSERQTLQHIAEGGFLPSELDWVAVQRLKTFGFVEAHRTDSVALTPEGRRALNGLLSNA